MKVFFHPVPWCASIEVWRSLWLQTEDPQLRAHSAYSHVLELMETLDAVHKQMEQLRIEAREQADWVYLPVYFPLMFWWDSDKVADCLEGEVSMGAVCQVGCVWGCRGVS